MPSLVSRDEFLRQVPPHDHSLELHHHHRYSHDRQNNNVDWLIPDKRSGKEDEGNNICENVQNVLREINPHRPARWQLRDPSFQIIVFLTPELSHIERRPMIVQLTLIGKVQGLAPLTTIKRMESANDYQRERDDHQKYQWPKQITRQKLLCRVYPPIILRVRLLNSVQNPARGLDERISQQSIDHRDDDSNGRLFLVVSPAKRQRISPRQDHRNDGFLKLVHRTPLLLV